MQATAFQDFGLCVIFRMKYGSCGVEWLMGLRRLVKGVKECWGVSLWHSASNYFYLKSNVDSLFWVENWKERLSYIY